MDNMIAVFGILVIIGFFASVVTGVVYLVMRSKTHVLLRKGFYTSVGVFLGALVLMIISLYSLEDSDEKELASKTQSETNSVVTNAEDGEPRSDFSYDETSAFADVNGDFSIDITVRKGLPVEFFEPGSDEGAQLKKIDESHYVLEGNISKDMPRGDYFIFYGTPSNEKEERISVVNDLAYKPSSDVTTVDEEPVNNDSYIINVEMDIEEVMGEYLEVDDEEVAVLEEVQVNDNAGKNDGSKLILIHLNTPMGLTSNKTQQKIDMQTLEITKAIYENPSIDFDIDSITYFWSVPIADKEGTIEKVFASKISLERKTLESLNYDRLKGIDVKQVADQYQSDIK